MGNALPRWTLDDYLEWENAQPERHEFIDGEVFLMTGGRRINGLVLINAATSLKRQLRGTGCQVFAEAMKLQIGQAVFYPDIFVTCDAADLRTDQIFRAPTVVIEILSPSTEAFDRGLKFAHYRGLPSLAEYALIDPATREVTLFRRGADGLFTLHDLTGTDALAFTSIGCSIGQADLFEDVDVRTDSDADPSAPSASAAR